MHTYRKSIRTLAFVVALGGLGSMATVSGAWAESANPCAPKVVNPCAPKPANPCAPKAEKPANPCAPKPANPCAPKK